MLITTKLKLGKLQLRSTGEMVITDDADIYVGGSFLAEVHEKLAHPFRNFLALPHVAQPTERPQYWEALFEYGSGMLNLLRTDVRCASQYEQLLSEMGDELSINVLVLSYLYSIELQLNRMHDRLVEWREGEVQHSRYPVPYVGDEVREFFEVCVVDERNLLMLDTLWGDCTSDDEFFIKLIDCLVELNTIPKAFGYPDVQRAYFNLEIV
jgi:hypothetical protein